MTKIKIWNKVYTVVFTNNKEDLLVKGKQCKASISYGKKIIWLDEKLKASRDNLSRAIMHEITHAFIYETKFTQAETYLEEDLCDFVAIYTKPIMQATERAIKGLLKEDK